MGTSTVKLNGTTLMTVADTTATASDVAQSKYFYAADGTKTAGTSTGGGGNTPWFGIDAAELIHSETYEISLADTNYSDITPTTSQQYLTFPATDYSTSGQLFTYARSNDAIDMSEYGFVVVVDSIIDVKYLRAESVMSSAHALRLVSSYSYELGRSLKYESGVGVVPWQPQSSGSSSNIGMLYRNNSNNLNYSSSRYGFIANVYSPTITKNDTTITKTDLQCRVAVQYQSAYMNSDAFANVDADNTIIMLRAKIYRCSYSGAGVMQSERASYMFNNGVFPSD